MTPRLLHLGSGGMELPFGDVEEITLDIDPHWNPDYVASITDLGEVGEYDLTYTCHCLEHVYLHEARQALKEMLRVIKKGGKSIVIVPDLEGINADREELYEAPCGPICGLDLIYGHSGIVVQNAYMAHKYGYTVDSLKNEFEMAGFSNVSGTRLMNHSIMVTGEK